MSGLVSLLFFHVVFRLADENCTGKMMKPTPSLHLTTTPWTFMPLSEFGTLGFSKNMTALLHRQEAVLAKNA